MLSQFYGKSPEEVTEQELKDYFLYRRNVDRWSANNMRAGNQQQAISKRSLVLCTAALRLQ